MSFCIVMMSLSSISVIVAKIYDQEEVVVNSAFTFFLLNAFVLNFPATSVLENFGIEKAFKVCAVVSIIGLWLRYYLIAETGNFLWIMPGTAMVAVCQPFIYVGVSKVATRWFADDERAMATTLMSLSDPIGCMIGMILGPMFVLDEDVKN